ncbi:MAG: Druantia anti-phage system protein DruA [Syntrophobacteraceae bacterium]
MDHEREPDTTSTMALPPSLEVRPITREQRSRWDRVMRQHYYLGVDSKVGEALRYVALHQYQRPALIGWCAAALSCKARDQRIGWPARLQHSRRRNR